MVAARNGKRRRGPLTNLRAVTRGARGPSMWRETWLGVLGACALTVGFPLTAEAGGELAEPAPPASAWSFDGGLYFWALWVEGNATAHSETFNVYADPIDLIEALDGPIFMGNFEARRGRFSFFADVVYAEFGLGQDFLGEAQPIPALTLTGSGRIGADYKFGVYQADAFYQIADFAGPNGGRTSVELGAGARYIEQELDITAAIDLNAKIQLGRLVDRLGSRIDRIENEEERLAALAQFNALRKQILEDRIVRAKDKGLNRRVARLEKTLDKVDNRGEAIAALEALDKLRLGLLQRALNLNNKQFNKNFAFVDTGNMSWVDPVIALRLTHDLGHGRSITAMGDFGGFNVDDGLSWQAVLAYNYEGTLFGYETTTTLGYKALWLDYEDNTSNGTRGIDAVLHGPIAELAFRW